MCSEILNQFIINFPLTSNENSLKIKNIGQAHITKLRVTKYFVEEKIFPYQYMFDYYNP